MEPPWARPHLPICQAFGANIMMEMFAIPPSLNAVCAIGGWMSKWSVVQPYSFGDGAIRKTTTKWGPNINTRPGQQLAFR
eukprot:NODE_1076_length_614_cov_63.840708_g1004_i0.p2 GENE.NODE_1076_length_614_cov_63.840708_g1004_i0~~NODE_1076_length_614_cov_63.840708_g1004_i0.p2  ORF type:complete len:80 (-),score=5.72 NODE_1076_length_614_cov_63.840708_g1004_i0:153-392(-)